MNDADGRMQARYEGNSSEDSVRAPREILHEIALLGLWRSKFFDKAAFYGGTALRLLYGLDRYSEDLDFSLLTPAPEFATGSPMPSPARRTALMWQDDCASGPRSGAVFPCTRRTMQS